MPDAVRNVIRDHHLDKRTGAGASVVTGGSSASLFCVVVRFNRDNAAAAAD
jgi:hypothetical protein